ncbi:hypothetical protein [Nonomuraea sp. NPDC050643]|uniref:hypothetical protein n=1 Tax=Nonomuraea sp. NPDC050643 TaxID=3155660 RepID=UPI0033E5C295
MRVRIDPNVRVRGGHTLASFEDVEGLDPATLHVGEVLTVYEPEAALRGDGTVVEVDRVRRLVILAVDWPSLRPETAWAGWDAHIAAILAGGGAEQTAATNGRPRRAAYEARGSSKGGVMSDFEYTITPKGRDDRRRWQWEGGPVEFDTSGGGEILDWSELREAR